MRKKWIVISVLVSFLFMVYSALVFITPIAQAEEAATNHEIYVKHLVVPINFTWGQKANNGTWHFDYGADGETREFNGSFDAGWLAETYKGKLELIGVESLNDSNFDFDGANDFWYKNDVVQTETDFYQKYVSRKLEGLSIENYSMKGTIASFGYSGTLHKDKALDIMPTAARAGGSVALDQELYPLMGGGIAAQLAYPEVCSKLEKELRGKTPNLDKSQMYCWFNPIVLTFKITQDADLSVERIHVPSPNYPPNTAVDIFVDVANNGAKSESSTIRFDFNGSKQEREVTLEPGSQQTINFAVNTPGSDGSYTIKAEINPDRTIVEQDYTNNKKTKTLVVKEIKNEIAPCQKYYIWTEIEIEWVTVCGRYSCWTYPIYHYFTYKATLNVDEALVTDDRSKIGTSDWKLNSNGTPHNWIRAGYGVKTNAKATVMVEQLSGDWTRNYTATVTRPSKASITTDWRMNNSRNLNTGQAKTVNLGIDGKGSGLSQTFKTLPNTANPEKPPVIYTNLDLPDGLANMTLRIQGAYVDGQELCVNMQLPIIIKGDLYDDYRIN